MCRFRPQSKNEIEKEVGDINPIVSFDDDMMSVKVESKEHPGTYFFDRVFDWSSTQGQVYDYAADSVVEDLMKGYNGTILTYGQTGSGKTYTMMGDTTDEETKGLSPRLVEKIFESIKNSNSNIEFHVKVSYMEIYQEKIRDLLNHSEDNLQIHEEKNRGVYVKGLTEINVASVSDVFEAMSRGNKLRVVGSHNVNSESSRSHSIFVIQVSMKNTVDGVNRTIMGKLYLVDLAGSEKVEKTGATGQTLEEAKKINKSLSALGMVINALTDGKSTHIPYRDSKLTRILQESIGGNSRTTLIVNCSPSPSNESETLSTLRFGVRAKTIRNKAKVNVEMSPTELKNLLKRVKASLETEQTYAKALEGEIGVWRSGATVPESEWVQRSAFAGASAEAANSKSVATTSSLTAEANTSSSISTPPVSSVASTRAEPMPLSKIKSSNSLFALSTGSLFDRIGANMPQETMTEDERDEFLRIQNELSDTLVEAQRTLKDAQTRVETMEEEIEGLRREHAASGEENRKMGADLSKLKLDLERVACENKENIVVAENLKEQNQTMVLEIKSLKTQLKNFQHTKPVDTLPEIDPTDDVHSRLIQLQNGIKELKLALEISKLPPLPESRLNEGALAKQSNEVDEMQKRLTNDLQHRCENVNELALMLDEKIKEYNNFLLNNFSRTQQHQLSILEQNLQQATDAKMELSQQNAVLEKELDIANRRLDARRDHVKNLEAMLKETEVRLVQQNQKFEEQLETMRKMLEEAKFAKEYSSWINSGRIAKPLRGGLEFPDAKVIHPL